MSDTLDTVEDTYDNLETDLSDNLEVSDENLVDDEVIDDEIQDSPDLDSEEEDEDEEDLDSEETEEDDANDNEKFVVKVDGESLEVTLDELKAGYSRQAHFTKSMQALKEEREQFETEAQQFVEVVNGMQQLDNAWNENPVSVLSNLITSVEQPEYALGLLIKDLATKNVLSAEALQYFNIDKTTLDSWQHESELDTLRRQVKEKEELENQIRSEASNRQQQIEIENAIKNFEATIDNIITSEELEFSNDNDMLKFRAELLGYAKDNNIFDLRKAYAAMQYELSKSAKAKQTKAEKAQSKKSANKVVSKSGAGMNGATAVNNGKQDLRSIIETTMKELEF